MTLLEQKVKNGDLKCRLSYKNIERTLHKNGINDQIVDNISKHFCCFANGKYYLKNNAYKPTGIALGCPLPNTQLKRYLWRIALLLENTLAKLNQPSRRVFALVPADWYHITLLNRSHFLHNRRINSLTAGEQKDIAEITNEVLKVPIVIHVNGLMLASSGAVIVPTFPFDNQIYDLKSIIIKQIPAFSVNMPSGAHIKLGNILQTINKEKLSYFLHVLAICGTHISERLEFSDIHSPRGRIQIK